MDIKYYYNFTDGQMKKYGDILQPLMDKLYDMEKVDTLLKEKFKEWTDKNDELVNELDDNELMCKGTELAIKTIEEELGIKIDKEEAGEKIFKTGFYVRDEVFDIMKEKSITSYEDYYTSVIHHEAYSRHEEDLYETVQKLADTEYELWDDIELVINGADLLELCVDNGDMWGYNIMDRMEKQSKEETQNDISGLIDWMDMYIDQAKTLIEEVDKNFIQAKEDLDYAVNDVLLTEYYYIALGRLEFHYGVEVAI